MIWEIISMIRDAAAIALFIACLFLYEILASGHLPL
jgi:hypothetical protein